MGSQQVTLALSKDKQLRHGVFWPPFLLTIAGVILSISFGEPFVSALNAINLQTIDVFSGALSWGGLLTLFTCLACCLPPFGKQIIGGAGSRPMLRLYDWLAISLCTNSAVGIFFWATAEPMYHLQTPPVSLGFKPASADAANFALSSLYMHWSFIPASLYTLPALSFAIAFYNRKQPFSLASCLEPLIGAKRSQSCAAVIDATALFALVSGMSASLATGILTLAGGLEFLYGWESAAPLWIVLGIIIVASFLASALSGLDKGIRILSSINTQMFFAMLAFFLVFAPMVEVFQLGSLGLGSFAKNFLNYSTLSSFAASDSWPKQWTLFYWAVWAAWAPVTAMFLGKISYGYSVRMFVVVNLLVPAVFAIIWMFIIGGTALSFEMFHDVGLSKVLAAKGPESVAYAVFNALPYASILIPFFLFSVFISYVTSADSNTLVMASMCTKGISTDDSEPRTWVKYLWAGILASLSILMLCLSGIDGIRTLSYLGGVPAMIFEWICMASVWRLLLKPGA